MKVTILKISRRKEVINREELTNVAMAIREGSVAKEVKQIRQVYHLMRTERQADGQVLTDFSTDINLPRICFAAEYAHKNHERLMVSYNGLVVLELNGLDSYEQAVTLRNQASKMPETLMAFLGGSGKSVKIVCRGELYEKGSLPKEEEEIRQFHKNLYETARLAYQNQFQMNIEYLEPRLDRTVYLSADPEVFFNPEARAFLADTKKPEQQEPVSISEESDSLMPGRTIDRTYHLNWLFIVNNVLGRYFELPDEQREMELLMRVATACLNEGIPMAQAQQLTLSHPVLGRDEILVRNIFDSVYAVTLQEDYLEKHPFKPLKSVPEETIQAMRTEIFLNANFFMRKNLMTGVAEYRERYSNDQTYKPLTEEVRNDMTLRAVELGLKAWDKNVNRFIDSTRIEQYDPVNTWLDKLPQWDGHDYIKELAGRVPTDQPHWEKYLKMWLTGMVAQWRESDKQLTGNALVPLLIGRQGCGKTRFCKIILPPELRDYYNDKINFKNEFDLNIALTSFALINIDEFDKTTKSQQVVLKYLLSSADVKFRPPYGKTIKQYRRYTSFIGTTNKRKPLTDPTGSRRFACIGVTGHINYDDSLNHQQLFAQALHLFNNGERFWLNDVEIAELIKENECYQQLYTLEEMIAGTFRSPKPSEEARWLSIDEIKEILSCYYASFDPGISNTAMGNALNDTQFNFEVRRTNQGKVYRMVEQ
ncbi:MAG: hypothetical protein J6T43_08495 [Prevotella sp.]|nr:hypothetical protein [Prevotella sp.]